MKNVFFFQILLIILMINLKTGIKNKISIDDNKKSKLINSKNLRLSVDSKNDSVECNVDLTSLYIKTPDLKNSIETTELMLSECPKMESSCCSQNEFSYLIEQTKSRGTQIEVFKSYFISSIELISQLTESQMTQFIETVSSYDCLPTDGATLDISQTHIRLSKNHLISNMNRTLDHFRAITSSLVCSVCDGRNGGFFIETAEPRETRMLIDIDYCKRILNVDGYEVYLKFFKSLRFVNSFYRSVGCMNEEDWKVDNVLEYDKYMMMGDYIPVCSKGDNYLTELNCEWICRNFPTVNKNLMFSLMKNIVRFRNFVKDMFPQKKKGVRKKSMKEVKISGLEREFESEIFFGDKVVKKNGLKSNFGEEQLVPFEYYLDSVDGSKKDLSEYKWRLSEERGWNLANNYLSEYHQKVVGGLKIGFMVLFTLIWI